MKRAVMILAALTLWAGVAGAVTDTQDGQSTRGVQQGRLGGAILDADSTMRVNRANTSGHLLTAETSPLNSLLDAGTTIMDADTMSVNGRTLDSTSVFPCDDYGVVTVMFKMDGHHDAVGKIVRIAIMPIWSNSAMASDTTMTANGGYGLMLGGPGTSTVASFAPDSLGPISDATAHTALPGVETVVRFLNRSIISVNSVAYRTAVLSYRNPGYKYVRWYTRVLSDTGTAATQGFRFKLSAIASGRAL